MNTDEFENLVLDSIAKVRAEGIDIRYGTYGNFSLCWAAADRTGIVWDIKLGSGRYCCALGAVALAMPIAELGEVTGMTGPVRAGWASRQDALVVVEKVARHCGLSSLDKWAFVEGFDLEPLDERMHNTGKTDPWYDLGKKIRENLGDSVRNSPT